MRHCHLEGPRQSGPLNQRTFRFCGLQHVKELKPYCAHFSAATNEFRRLIQISFFVIVMERWAIRLPGGGAARPSIAGPPGWWFGGSGCRSAPRTPTRGQTSPASWGSRPHECHPQCTPLEKVIFNYSVPNSSGDVGDRFRLDWIRDSEFCSSEAVRRPESLCWREQVKTHPCAYTMQTHLVSFTASQSDRIVCQPRNRVPIDERSSPKSAVESLKKCEQSPGLNQQLRSSRTCHRTCQLETAHLSSCQPARP